MGKCVHKILSQIDVVRVWFDLLPQNVIHLGINDCSQMDSWHWYIPWVLGKFWEASHCPELKLLSVNIASILHIMHGFSKISYSIIHDI
jgi:hypothetical protein